MSRPRNTTPTYIPHKSSGRGRLQWYDALGVRREKLLPGPFGSPESLAAKARLELELATSPTGTPAAEPSAVCVAEVLNAFLDHAERYYVDAEGNPTKEQNVLKYAFRPVRDLYGATPAMQFGPVALKAVRQHMIDNDLTRALVNRRIDAVKRAFRWAASEELVPVSVYEALRTLPGLRRGRTTAREAEPVLPVDDATVDATLPFLPPHVRAMVELMRYTGMRPAEVCALTLNQIERGAVWTYIPKRHKTAYQGRRRVIPFGPSARALLSAFLAGKVLAPDEPVFSPARAREERFAEMRKNRKSKVQPSQTDRKKGEPKKVPGARYRPEAVSHAVKLAARKAGVPHWHPYRLRHAFATKVRKEHGLEAAQVLLGHSRADVTQVYAERNESLALTVAAKIG